MRTFAALGLCLIAIPAFAQGPDSPEAARGVIESYYAAIDRGSFRGAYRLWDRDGAASGKSYAAFRQGFAGTARTRVVTHAPINANAGMSQRWIDVPVDVYATLKSGRKQRFRGTYTLHRVVEGVGAPSERTGWHIATAHIRLVG